MPGALATGVSHPLNVLLAGANALDSVFLDQTPALVHVQNGWATLRKSSARDISIGSGRFAGNVALIVVPEAKVASLRAASFGTRAAESVGGIRTAEGVVYNGITGPGPLGADVASTFRSGSYLETVTSQETLLYRVYGGKAGPLSKYWTRTTPSGPLQATTDSALLPKWGNTAQSIATIRVPAGTTIYEGAAAGQGGLVGGGSQVVIPRVNPRWLVQGN